MHLKKSSLSSPFNIITTPWYEKHKKDPSIEEKKYLIDPKILHISSWINKNILEIISKSQEKLSYKIKIDFSELPKEYLHLAEMTFWDLEHTYWLNRLAMKSKIMDAISLWKNFTYASYDVNWMWISNNLSKNLWNLRILELWHISYEAISYLDNFIDENWKKIYESYFSRNWWDEFSLFSTAPNEIVKKAIEYWKTKLLWDLKEDLNEENYKKLISDTAKIKWWNSEKEILEKISWFTVWINNYDYSETNIEIKNLQKEYKKIVISTDQIMEHTKNWIWNHKLENWIVLWNKIWWKHIDWKEKTLDLQNFIQNNKLNDTQNKIFENMWKNLWYNIKKDFHKLTKNRNKIIEKLNLKEKDIVKLDYLLEKAKYTKDEVNEIQKITNLKKSEINQLKIEYMRTLFTRWHYTWSYQPQVQNVITKHPESLFSIKNKVVINTPSFKSINEICWHTNWDYFLMEYVQYLKDEIFKLLDEEWIDKSKFWKNIIIVSKWPNTEIFFKDTLIHKRKIKLNNIKNKNWKNKKILSYNDDIITKFKNKINSSNFLEKFNEKIWKDENWKTLNDKRIDFIKNKQKNKIFDKIKEIILIKLWDKLQNEDKIKLEQAGNKDEVISFYKEIKMQEISKNLKKQGSTIKNKKLNNIWDIFVKNLVKTAENQIKEWLNHFEILK